MKNKRILFIAILLLSLTIIFTGCGQETSTTAAQTETSSAATETQAETETTQAETETTQAETETTQAETAVQTETTTQTESETQTELTETEAPEETITAETPAETQVSTAATTEESASSMTEPTSEVVASGPAIRIEGLASGSMQVTLDEMKAMQDLVFEADFYSLNSYGTTGYTHFKGMNLGRFLSEVVGVSGTSVTITATDGYYAEFTMAEILRQDYIDETDPNAAYPVIIAWEENGNAYSEDDGAPFKLVVGQKEAGDVNKPLWVSDVATITIH